LLHFRRRFPILSASIRCDDEAKRSDKAQVAVRIAQTRLTDWNDSGATKLKWIRKGRVKEMKLTIAFGAATIAVLLSSGSPAVAQALPAQLKSVMQSALKFSSEEIKAVESGAASAHVFETGDPEDVFIVGAVRIGIRPADFIAKYRNVTEFESGPGVPAGAKFNTPPTLKDLAGLNLVKSEVDDLKDCQPGDCTFKIADRGLQRIRSQVNWKSPNYVAEANNLIRNMWLEGLLAYQSNGNSALSAYHDSEKITKVQDGLNSMVKNLPVLQQSVPEMANYLVQFPQGRPAGMEDFYYWQLAEFGLKPVHRVTHVMMQKKPAQYGDGYLIASKMLYASHYFRSALEFRFLIPAAGSDKSPQTFLVVLQRSYVDGLGGFKGKLLRGPILSKSRDALERYLLASKNKLEGKPAAKGK
jgi:hypothetical protein